MVETYFKTHCVHLEGSAVVLTSLGSELISVGSDEVQWRNSPTPLHNDHHYRITAASFHPTNITCVYGTDEGMALLCKQPNNLDRSEIIYKGDGAVKRVVHFAAGRLIAIAGAELSCIIYDCKHRKLKRAPNDHAGLLLNVKVFAEDILVSLATDAKIHVYQINLLPVEREQNEDSEDSFAEFNEIDKLYVRFVDSYVYTMEKKEAKVPTGVGWVEHSSKEPINGKILKGIILVGGLTTLQQIYVYTKDNQISTEYALNVNVHEHSEIILIEVVNSLWVTITKSNISMWNSSGNKLFNFKLEQIGVEYQIQHLCTFNKTSELQSFAFICSKNNESDGNIYEFVKYGIFEIQPQEEVRDEMEEEEEESKKEVEPQQRACLVISEYPQLYLQKCYNTCNKARFLYYNHIGCVIERTENEHDSTLELSLHDRSRISRIRLNPKHQTACFFCLANNCFLYASPTHLVFQEEKMLRQNYDWEYEWNDIQAICIGVQWVAAANSEEIKCLDYYGSEMHSIAFDRMIIAMEAYEDILAVVYHFDAPLWGCQTINMALFIVNERRVRKERDVIIPILPNSLVKWFGFSEEGMIYCYDKDEILRSYDYGSNEWMVVLNMGGEKEKIFIQHIQNYEVFGFKIEQKEDEWEDQPKVMPRSLPRKITLQIPCFQFNELSFLRAEERSAVQRLVTTKWKLRHEEYRYERWYKYKYARSKEHPFYSEVQTIYSADEIETKHTEIDLQLIEYIRKFILNNSSSPERNASFTSLLLLVARLAHFEDTILKIKSMVEQQIQRNYSADFKLVKDSYKTNILTLEEQYELYLDHIDQVEFTTN